MFYTLPLKNKACDRIFDSLQIWMIFLELKLNWSCRPSSLSVTAVVSLSWQETQRNDSFSISKCKDYTLKHPQCCCFTDVHRYLFFLLLQFMSKPDCGIM